MYTDQFLFDQSPFRLTRLKMDRLNGNLCVWLDWNCPDCIASLNHSVWSQKADLRLVYTNRFLFDQSYFNLIWLKMVRLNENPYLIGLKLFICIDFHSINPLLIWSQKAGERLVYTDQLDQTENGSIEWKSVCLIGLNQGRQAIAPWSTTRAHRQVKATFLSHIGLSPET